MLHRLSERTPLGLTYWRFDPLASEVNVHGSQAWQLEQSESFAQPIRLRSRSGQVTSIDTLPPAMTRTEGAISLKPLCHQGVGLHSTYRPGKRRSFYILEGELSFYGDEGEIVASQGTYLNIPKGAKHRFRNNGDATARMLFFFTPAGIEGLFDELATMEVPSGDFPSVIKALNVLGEGYGVEYLAE